MIKTFRSLLFSLLLTFPLASFGQQVADYIQKLQDASNADDFNGEFDKMISSFHQGKLKFDSTHVNTVVNIARNKTFANQLLPRVYGWAGSMFGDGRMDEAILYFLKSADEFKALGNKLGQALCLFEIALVQHKAENYDEAEEYYNLTLSLKSEGLPYRTTINCHNGLALIKRNAKQYDSAMSEFRSAYQVALVNNDVAWLGILSGNIGSCHFALGNYDSSLYYYENNLRFIRKTNEFENEIETYANLGKVFLKKGQLKKSAIFLDSALFIIESRKIVFNDFFNPMDDIYQTYAELSAQKGDFAKAFAYEKKFHEVSREKQRNINGRSLKQLQAVYSFSQKQKEIEYLKDINTANLVVIKQQRYIGVSFAIVIITLSVLTFIAFKTSRQRKKLNLELVTSNTELAKLNNVKDKLFSVISHDLRSPIGNMKSILALFDEGAVRPEELIGFARNMNHQLEVSGRTLENVLHWAKMHLNEIKANLGEVQVNEIVTFIINQFQDEIRQKKLNVQNSVDDTIKVFADYDQVEIVIRNLLSNAIKFTPPSGNITLTATRESGFIAIVIKDTGVGMTEGQLEKLFQPGVFFTTLGTNNEKGTGIGLVISKEMVENNGGSITANSDRGKGTCFTIRLPEAESKR
jgi:signal transduction histidine kinase